MERPNIKLLRSIGLISSSSSSYSEIFRNSAKLAADKVKSISRTLSNYNDSQVVYTSSGGDRITGYDALMRYIDDPTNKNEKVYANHWKEFDLALEGGGTFGFAHIGAIHAFALKGIGFDRFSGTSAGSIVAALMAAGYKVDLNYKVDSSKSISGTLRPHPDNSINQILFESDFTNFSDFPVDINSVRNTLNNGSFINIIIESVADWINEFEQNAAQKIIDNIHKAIFFDPNNPGIHPFGPFNGLVEGAVRFMMDFLFLGNIDDILGQNSNNAVIKVRIVNLFTSYICEGSNSVKKTELWAIIRLFEYGGFWDGTFLRDWIELHLQEKIQGTGELLNGRLDRGGIRRPNIRRTVLRQGMQKAVTFKDLPFDLCITTSAIGELGNEYDNRKAHLIFFSKKTSPDYPVAEAVRRSVSLPFVFVPRTLQDGYVGRATIRKTSDFDLNDFITGGSDPFLTSASPLLRFGNFNLPIPSVPASISKSKNVPMNHVCQDGGFYLNLPVSVFRDRANEVFDCEIDPVSNDFKKTLVISNLNQSQYACERPFDIPLVIEPEPVKSISNSISTLGAGSSNGFFEKVFAQPGVQKLVNSIKNLLNFSPLGEWKSFEVDLLLELVPNSLLVQNNLLDPLSKRGDTRLTGLSFNISTSTKKWLLKNGFEGVKTTIKEGISLQMISPRLEISDVDPYNHIVRINNLVINPATPNNLIEVYPNIPSWLTQSPNTTPIKDGDFVFSGNTTISFGSPPPFNAVSNRTIYVSLGKSHMINNNGVYLGMGYYLLKVRNNQFNVVSNRINWISFDTDVDVLVTILSDKKPDANMQDWTLHNYKVLINRPQAIDFFAFSCKKRKGRVEIPGARYFISSNDNSYPLIVLVKPL